MPLPDLNEGVPDEYFYGVDSTLFIGNDESGSEDLVRDDRPFYQNQLEDPVCRALFDDDMS